jgi:hypothetical protein
MFVRVVKRVLTFSLAMTLAFALLMFDPHSPSLVSEAQACDLDVYQACRINCGIACYSWAIYECHPDTCNCEYWCTDYCLGIAGC